MSTAAADVAELREAVASAGRVLPVGGATKPALSRTAAHDVSTLDISKLAGIIEYDPAELTFTALAGTPVADVAAMLAEHGQCLPCDPPFAAAGATLGGAVAAGVSGCNAFRRGGVRDFLIGVQVIDGTGRLINGGGKVVKNAAGFDLPKLLVGSIGRLGVMTRLSFKVFPSPEATLTLSFELGSRQRALAAMDLLARGPLEIDALELDDADRLLVRLGGRRTGLPGRADRCVALLDSPAERSEDAADAALWHEAECFSWVPSGHRLVRVALTLAAVPALERALADTGARLRIGLGGSAASIAWPQNRPLDELGQTMRGLGLRAIVLTGAPERQILGEGGGGAFAERVTRALDPDGRFLAVD